MKHILITTLVTFSFMSCKAQQTIIPLYGGIDYGNTENAYYKDTYNDFDKFIGTWEYTNGNQTFKVILKKKAQNLYNEVGDIPFYEDFIYGEYQYIDETGNELVNTLANIDDSSLDVLDHLIYGNHIVHPKYPPACDDCEPTERRLDLHFEDSGKDYLNYSILLRHKMDLDDNGLIVEVIELVVDGQMSWIPDGGTIGSRIPYGEYVLIKQ